MMDAKDRRIMAQTAFKVAGWIHAAEVNGGAEPDLEHLARMAKEIATGMKTLAGEASGSPSAGEAGGTRPSVGVAGTSGPVPPTPSCPRCNEPMERNNKWEGPGDKAPKWRCSQRGRFVKGSGWTGCNGAKWEDVAS